MQLQGCSLIRIIEMWWESSHAWSAAIDGHRLFRKNRLGLPGRGVALDVKGQWECLERCLVADNRTSESA